MKKIIFTIGLFFVFLIIGYGSTKRALLIGITEYLGDKNTQWRELKNLHGCVNDVNLIKATITQPRFGFKENDITVLLNAEATRIEIIKALENLASESNKGDVAFFYYSGHGSQWKNTREPDGYDESIVPADGFIDTTDIRDVELKRMLNKILAKGVILTVIMDCCHSGSGTRGIIPVETIYRYAAPIEKDLAEVNDEPAPGINPLALILAASHEDESAQEILNDHELNNEPYGVFTSALVKAINSSFFNESAENIFIRAKSIVQGGGYGQIPDIEGQPDRKKKSLFGGEVEDYNGLTMVPVIQYLSMGKFVLNGGIALGLRVNCELVKRDVNKNVIVRMKITELKGVNKSIAEVIQGESSLIKSGDLVELDKKTYGGEPNIRIYIAPSGFSWDELNEIASEIKLPGNIHDPITETMDNLVYYDGSSWKMYNKKGSVTDFGSSLDLQKIKEAKKVFIILPPTGKIYQGLKKEFEKNTSIELVTNPSEASYILTGRYNNGKIEYAWIMQNADIKDEENAASVPIRTNWIVNSGDETPVIDTLSSYALRLGKILAWNNLANSVQDTCHFPYKLALRKKGTNDLIRTGVVDSGMSYYLVLVKDYELFPSWKDTARYVYVFAIDVSGKMTLLYPDPRFGINKTVYPEDERDETIVVDSIKIGPPFGNDNYFLLTTNQLIEYPANIFENEGVYTSNQKGISDNPLIDLLNDVGTTTKGINREMPTNWSIERITIRSMKK